MNRFLRYLFHAICRMNNFEASFNWYFGRVKKRERAEQIMALFCNWFVRVVKKFIDIMKDML